MGVLTLTPPKGLLTILSGGDRALPFNYPFHLPCSLSRSTYEDGCAFGVAVPAKMAEMLGAVASGISIAQFAGSIIKIGFRIKSLLEDIRDVPDDLQHHLGQIQVLAPLLAEIDHGPSISNGALLAAAKQCQQAARELEVLASELSNQVQSSQGFNRRFRSLQAVLQKSALARHEKRMQVSMQMLMLALQLTSLCRQNDLM